MLQTAIVLLWGIHIKLGGRKAGVTGIIMGVGTVFLRNDLLAWLAFNGIQEKTDRTRQTFCTPLIPVPKSGFLDLSYFRQLFRGPSPPLFFWPTSRLPKVSTVTHCSSL